MKKNNQQNRKFEQIEKDLFEATKLSDEKIEEIVSKPNLFASIEAEIKTTENKQLQVKDNSSWLGFSFAKSQLVFSASAVFVFLTILLTLIIGGNYYSNQLIGEMVENKMQPIVIKDQKPQIPREVKEKENAVVQEQIAFKKKNTKTHKYTRRIKPIKTSKVSTKKSVRAERVQKRKVKKTNSQKVLEKNALLENRIQKVFYSLPLNENKDIRSENLQVVRTELSRSQLFALGVNLQLENGKPKFKAEVLVGEDGKARALRLIEE